MPNAYAILLHMPSVGTRVFSRARHWSIDATLTSFVLHVQCIIYATVYITPVNKQMHDSRFKFLKLVSWQNRIVAFSVFISKFASKRILMRRRATIPSYPVCSSVSMSVSLFCTGF